MRCSDITHLQRGGGAKRAAESKDEMSEKSKTNSLSRAKQRVRSLIRASEFDNLLTLTFRECVLDFDYAWTVFSKFRRLMKARYKTRFSYVVVPELQSRGAIHFHLALKGYYGVEFVRAAWHIALGSSQLGNVDFSSRKRGESRSKRWDGSSIARYLSKYLTKGGDIVGIDKKRYARSVNLPLPNVVRCFSLPGLELHIVFKSLFYELFRRSVAVRFEPDDRPGFLYMST